MKKLPLIQPQADRTPLPPWFKVRARIGPSYQRMRAMVDAQELHTVCEEARCPNLWDCWNRGTATFMILGDICTRSCGFCAVEGGRPVTLDRDEPRRVGEAVRALGLRHAVITSVNRDELSDGGAEIFAETIRQVRALNPAGTIEVLIPDFQGNRAAQACVFGARPDILNHNLETVPRLYPTVRPQAKYHRSLMLLQDAKARGLRTKTGIMVGLGETRGEIEQLMRDVVTAGCDILTIGQYLQPTRRHLPVARYYEPREFDRFREVGVTMGLRHVEAGPLVRSSFHADEQARGLL